jgi:(p)ppGpp synthase/HD superfamily hydrolase
MDENYQAEFDYLIEKRGKMFRKGGLPGITHELSILRRLANWGINQYYRNTWQLAMFHDLFEDTDATHAEMTARFSKEPADLTTHMTFRPRRKNESSADYQAYKIEALNEYRFKPIECVVVKGADRLGNVEDFMPDNPSYARTYFGYAEGLFTVILDRGREIAQAYSPRVMANMLIDINEVRTKVSHVRA